MLCFHTYAFWFFIVHTRVVFRRRNAEYCLHVASWVVVFQVLVEREALRAELCCARARQASEYYPPRTPIGDAHTLAHCGGSHLFGRLIARRQFPEPSRSYDRSSRSCCRPSCTFMVRTGLGFSFLETFSNAFLEYIHVAYQLRLYSFFCLIPCDPHDPAGRSAL